MVNPKDTSEHQFDALYRECSADVFAYVASLLRDRAAAEDVTALAFERAYRRRRRFDARRGSERAWLFGIARNAALDELRRRKRRARLFGEPADDGAIAAFDAADEHGTRRIVVRDALDSLQPRDRELVALKFIAGFSNQEIAALLGTSESNAGTRLHRVITQLREACDETA